MKTYNINLNTGACSTYTGFDFNSACLAEDGNYYALRSDGLYKIGGVLDGVSEIEARVDMGKQDFGDTSLKHVPVAYVGAASADKLVLEVQYEGSSYEYSARDSSEELQQQRFDLGKGIRANWIQPILKNQGGADFEIADFSMSAVPTQRRI